MTLCFLLVSSSFELSCVAYAQLEDAVHTAILTLKEGFEGALYENNIEIGIVQQGQPFHKLTPSEIKDYLTEME